MRLCKCGGKPEIVDDSYTQCRGYTENCYKVICSCVGCKVQTKWWKKPSQAIREWELINA